jgi:hypothetical protein
MSNIILGYGSIIANAGTLTGGTYEATLPLSNSRTDILAAVARTTTGAEITVTIPFTTDQTVGCIAMCNHNFSADAQVQFVVKDNGVTPTFIPTIIASSTIKPRIDTTRNSILTFWLESNVTTCRSIEITINDPLPYAVGDTITAGSFVSGRDYEIISAGSTDFTLIGAANSTVGTRFTASGVGTGTGTAKRVGLQFGYIPVMKQFETSVNAEYGALSHGVTDMSTNSFTKNGVKFSDIRQKLRTSTFTLAWLTETESLEVNNLKQLCGITSPIVYGLSRPAYDALVPDEKSSVFTFIGAMSELDALSATNFERYSTQFQIKELGI